MSTDNCTTPTNHKQEPVRAASPEEMLARAEELDHDAKKVRVLSRVLQADADRMSNLATYFRLAAQEGGEA